MAGKEINVNLSVNDPNGTLKKRNQDAKELNRELSRAAQLSEKALRPAAARGPAGEGTEYGRARGSMGGTGASARDFANQAQGLGGLVRVYATVAANLFAVTAAFNALKEAANTTNMIKGMDQLGAVSGVALGTMAQRFVQATDGAISLREAMSSVTKASAAGLSGTQIIQIAQFAKTASQALGLDMTDAVSRLTRGITKLEPELLDELGLFTKIGPATEKYAASIGKSALSLSDFERRQAFANAVLDEARQKFGSIELAANPYQKLEANIRNLTTSGLELINSFLTPLVSLVSNSGTALVTVLGLVAAKLTNMAIPALAGWRNELVETAVLAKEKAASINESFGEKFVQRTTSALKIPDITKELNKVEADYAAAKKKFLEEDNNIRQQARSKIISGLKEQEVSEETISRIKKDINKREDLTDAANARHVAAERQLLVLHQQRLLLKQKLNAAEQQAETQFQASNAEELARLTISKRAGARAEKLSILSQVGSNVEAGGFKFAIQELDKGLKSATDLKGWDKLKTKATGWAIAGASSAGVFLRALGGVGNAILAGIAVFTVLDGILSQNAEAMNEFNSQLKQAESTTKTAAAVMKMYGDSISAASTNAKANAFTQLSDDLDALTDKLELVVRDAGIWDKLKDSVFGFFGQGLSDEYSQKTAELLAAQIAGLPEGEIRQNVENKIKNILGVSGLSAKELEGAIGKKPLAEAMKLGREANKAAKEVPKFYAEINESIKSVEASASKANDDLMDITKSLSNTDPVTKFGASFAQLGLDVLKAFETTRGTVGAIDKLLAKPKALAIADIDVGELQSLKDVYTTLKNEEKLFNLELNASIQTLDNLKKIDLTGMTQQQIDQLSKDKKLLEDRIGTITVQLNARQINTKNIEEQLNNTVENIISKGFTLMESVVNNSLARAALSVRRNLYSGVSGVGVSQAATNIELKDISLQSENNRLLSQLNNTLIKANLLEARKTAQETIAAAQAKLKGGAALTEEEAQKLGAASVVVSEANAVIDRMATGKGFTAQELGSFSQAGVAKEAITYSTTTSVGRQKDAELNARKQIALDNNRLNTLKEQQDSLNLLEQSRGRTLELESKLNSMMFEGRDYLDDSAVLSKESYENRKLSFDQAQAVRTVDNEIALLQERINIATERKNAQDVVTFTNLKAQAQERKTNLTQEQSLEKTILAIQQEQFKIANKYAKLNAQRQVEYDYKRLISDTEKDSIQSQLELLDIRRQAGELGEQEKLNQELLLKTKLLSIETSDAIAQAAKARDDKLASINRDREVAEVAATKRGEQFNADYYKNLSDNANAYYNAEIDRINKNSDYKQQVLQREFSFQQRIAKDLANVLQSVTDKMADSFVSWATTGKSSFKDMANSIIADIARIIIKAQLMQMINMTMGNGWESKLGSWITKIAGFSMPGTGGNYTAAERASLAGLAKGGAFDTGVMKFAKGGMFTNKIVSEPTMFKFAKGTGLMGEAGPEAIMPLKRDQNGNLGVRTNQTQQNVEVVVNNFSGEKAEAKESMDSRGNRKIEIVVGEMIAGEVGRKGSPVQQAISSNFITRPTITRR